MRLAFVDLLFSWPPKGGADVDAYHVIKGLQEAGHAVQLIGVHDGATWDRGQFSPETLPFPAVHLDFTPKTFSRHAVPERIREAVDAFYPEVVVVCDGFFLKPYVILAMDPYPVISRYYAHEALCQRGITHVKEGAPCPNNYLDTPDVCRVCALDRLKPDIQRGHSLAWQQEYLAARAYAPEYHAVQIRALRQITAAIVYNDRIRQQMEPYCPRVIVMPGGVDADDYAFAEPREKSVGERKVILMTGRGEDPVKGIHVLRAAGELLQKKRNDFEIWVTAPEDTPGPAWFRPLGWRNRAEVRSLYQQADMCVVPSIWEEPFGMVALEAMAVGRPVCASRVGGLQTIVEHEKTGLLFAPGNAHELAQCLGRLLDDPPLRQRMGRAGRARVETEYTWKRIIDRYFPELFECAKPERRP